MPEIENVSVDYFTCTQKLSKSDEVYAKAKDISKLLELNYRPRPWHFFGYTGWSYSNPGNGGHFAYGEAREEIMGTIVQASGYFATRYVDWFLTSDLRWTRVDLCVDCQLEIAAPNLAIDYYTWVCEKGQQQRKYGLVQNTMGGTTLYVGSRQSYEFGRVYDKGIESKTIDQQGKLWRYEVELKQDKAKAAVQSLVSFHAREKQYSHPIAVTVYDWFDRRDIPPIWKRHSSESLNLMVRTETKHEDQKLLWLRKQVSPTVREMLASNKREVLDALGITEFYRLRRK